jgi:CRP/FNR family transcriptional regulator, cyclic AMP receptor protein
MTTNTEVLREIPLFRGMSDRSIEIIADIVRETSFPAGAALVKEGEPGESFMIIREGTATVDQGGRTLRELGAGDFLGEIALIDGGSRTATVTAAQPITALVIDRVGFSRLMNEFPVIRLDLVSALTQRLRQRSEEPLD